MSDYLWTVGNDNYLRRFNKSDLSQSSSFQANCTVAGTTYNIKPGECIFYRESVSRLCIKPHSIYTGSSYFASIQEYSLGGVKEYDSYNDWSEVTQGMYNDCDGIVWDETNSYYFFHRKGQATTFAYRPGDKSFVFAVGANANTQGALCVDSNYLWIIHSDPLYMNVPYKTYVLQKVNKTTGNVVSQLPSNRPGELSGAACDVCKVENSFVATGNTSLANQLLLFSENGLVQIIDTGDYLIERLAYDGTYLWGLSITNKYIYKMQII